MKILVTGASGLIGKRVCQYFLNENCHVIGLSRTNIDIYDDNFLFVKADLSDDRINSILEKKIQENVDVIIHCAAQQPRAECGFNEYQSGNIDASVNILDFCCRKNIKKIIVFSTVAFIDLPKSENHLVDEMANLNPVNNYALTKLTAEYIFKLNIKSNDLSVLCFRIPSLVQEEQHGGLIHTYFSAAIKNKELKLYDMGIYKRNLIYIESILELLSLSLSRDDIKKWFNLFNIGSMDSLTMQRIAEIIFTKTNSSGKIIPVTDQANIQGHWNLDVSKAVKELGFSPWTTENVLNSYIDNMLEVKT